MAKNGLKTAAWLILLLLGVNVNAQIDVKTAQEFVDNAKTNNTLFLTSEKIVLSELKSSSNPHIRFEDVYGSTGKEVHIKDVHNLTIDGSKVNSWAEMVTEPTYGNVLVFENCKGLTLKNFIAGHGPEKGQCLGGVLKFENCYKVKIENAELYGSGTYGIIANNTTVLECKGVTIKECTYGILDFNKVERFDFVDCYFNDNQGYDMLNLNNSSGNFTRVKAIRNITKHGYFINASNSELVSTSLNLKKENSFSKGLCNDWSNFSRVDFFGFRIEGAVDPGLAKRLNYEEPENRYDLVKKWKVQSYQPKNEEKIYTPKKEMIIEFKNTGEIQFYGEGSEKFGKYSWSPLGDENLYISVSVKDIVYAWIAKVYKKDNGVSLSMVVDDLAVLNLVPFEKNLLNKEVREQVIRAEYVSAEHLMEGEGMFTFKNKRDGAFLNFIFEISQINPIERRFVSLNQHSQVTTKNSLVGKEFDITYTETEGEDPNTGGGITILKLKKAVGITIIPEKKKRLEQPVDSFSADVHIPIKEKESKYPHLNDDIGKAVANNDLAHYIRTNASYKYISSDGKLTKLQFRNKGLSDLPENLKELIFLEEIDISSNRFTVLPKVIFEISSLKVLKFTNNQIITVPDDISKLNNLTSIYAYSNAISELPSALGKLNNIRVMDFSRNQIKKIDESIGNLSGALYDLNLSTNQLTELPSNIGNCAKITHLELANNQLNSVPSSITNLSGMKVLKLNNNQLKSIPENIGNLQSLKKLWLHNNPIETVPSSIYTLDKLKELGKGREFSRTKAEKKSTEAFVNRVFGGKVTGGNYNGMPTKN